MVARPEVWRPQRYRRRWMGTRWPYHAPIPGLRWWVGMTMSGVGLIYSVGGGSHTIAAHNAFTLTPHRAVSPFIITREWHTDMPRPDVSEKNPSWLPLSTSNHTDICICMLISPLITTYATPIVPAGTKCKNVSICSTGWCQLLLLICTNSSYTEGYCECISIYLQHLGH